MEYRYFEVEEGNEKFQDEIEILDNVLETLDGIQTAMERDVEWLLSDCIKIVDEYGASLRMKPVNAALADLINFLKEQKDLAENC